jgi:hypothetical protein
MADEVVNEDLLDYEDDAETETPAAEAGADKAVGRMSSSSFSPPSSSLDQFGRRLTDLPLAGREGEGQLRVDPLVRL